MMQEHFAPLLKENLENVWLAAESGYLYRNCSSNSSSIGGDHGSSATWRKLISLSNKVWFNSVYEVMRTYTENVDGAAVEESESTLVWNYKNAEEEHGGMVVGELYTQIKQILGNCPVEII